MYMKVAPTWHKPSEAYVLQGCIKNYSLVKLYNKALNNGHEIKILNCTFFSYYISL